VGKNKILIFTQKEIDMSTESAVQFLEETWNNADLKDKVREQNSVSEIMEVASQTGYDFTEEEFYEAQMEIVDRYDIELNEEALEAAAGGVVLLSNSGQNCCDCHHGTEQQL
jgi:predicted ribosomally synthesized peptide with nif11-like leader